MVVSAPSASAEVEPPDFTPKRRAVGLGQVLLISVLAALLAGALGGALGYVTAVRSGAGNSPVLGGGGASAPALAQRAPTSLAGVVKAVLPSVVTIRVDTGISSAIGSGFIVTPDGYLITNDHVVEGLTGTATVVFSNSTTAQAKLVGADVSSDIAVLKLNKTGLPAVTFGDSDSVAVGDPVLAIGAPLDLQETVTYGIVSALHRPLEIGSTGPTRYYSAIQTDAAVNHGNSGGPLFDAAGRVIGVDSVIESPGSDAQDAGNIGLAFAIPINQARRVAEQLIDTGKVTHTVIGATAAVGYQQDPNGGVPLGVVASGGPADSAGIHAGDVIMQIGGAPLTESGDLIALVREYAPGSVVPVVYTRNGVSHTAQVKLA
ncbi:MAG TPA: trypsin-like peptidase domain-containing protein, partial [Micromonosporaceae bacterium]